MRPSSAMPSLLALCLAACVSLPEAPPEAGTMAAPPPVAQPAPVAVPEESAPAVRKLVLIPVPDTPPAAPRSKAATRPPATAKPADKSPARPPAVATRPQAPGGVVKVSMAAPPGPVKTTPPGPEWLKACKSRQVQGDVILCDADSLLAHPGDKVLVYTRDARRVGKLPSGGSIALRENLPSLYRFFVLQ